MRQLKKQGELLELLYVGSHDGPERELVEKWGWNYVAIPVGKWRRYWDWKNVTDPFKVAAGVMKSLWIVKRFRPDVIFSKGGFVSVPVIVAGWLCRVPIVIHDSDAIPGLTTRLAARFARTICLGYAEAAKRFPAHVQHKIVVTGIPVRAEILKGDREKGLALTGFNSSKPVVLVMGGSLGAVRLNQAVEGALPELLKTVQVIHLTGKGKRLKKKPLKGYKPFDYVHDELGHLYALSDLIVSRAGANALAEIQAVGKPCILVPLGLDASHGDQIANARRAAKTHGYAVITDEDLKPTRLNHEIHRVLREGSSKKKRPSKSGDAARTIATLLLSYDG